MLTQLIFLGLLPTLLGAHPGRAVVGPLLVGPTGSLAQWAGFPELAGPYSVSLVGLILAAILIFAGLRPDPRDIRQELARRYPESVPRQETRSLTKIVQQPGVMVAMVSVVFAQMVMVVPMSITSVHMKAHHHPLSALSLVISAHTLGMFAFSIKNTRFFITKYTIRTIYFFEKMTTYLDINFQTGSHAG